MLKGISNAVHPSSVSLERKRLDVDILRKIFILSLRSAGEFKFKKS